MVINEGYINTTNVYTSINKKKSNKINQTRGEIKMRLNNNLALNNSLTIVVNDSASGVVGFKSESVESRIKMFLNVVGENSVNTYQSYKGHINEYFMFVTGKELDSVKWEDVYKLRIDDTYRYREYLKNKGQVATTINTKIASLSALFQFLAPMDEGKLIDSNVVNVRRMKPSTKDVSYGSLTEEEFETLLDFCDEERLLNQTKRLFFEIAINTGMRKNAILNNLTWGNITSVLDRQTETRVRVIKDVEDKGGKNDLVPISDEFYDRLMEFKESLDENEQGNDSRVVGLNPKTVESVMRRWKKEYKIDESRNISIHSIKSTGCDIVWNRTRDIKAVSDYAHHSDINTTYNHYLGKNESLMSKASYFAFKSEKTDLSGLENLSKDEIIELIRGCSMGTVGEILGKLK